MAQKLAELSADLELERCVAEQACHEVISVRGDLLVIVGDEVDSLEENGVLGIVVLGLGLGVGGTGSL